MDFKDPNEEIKEKFKKILLVKALLVPVSLMKTLTSQYKEFFFNMPKHPAILKELLPNNCKKVLLNLDLSKSASESWPEKLSSFISTNEIKIQDHEILLGYEDYTFTETLQEILPKDVTIPSGFEIVGTLAHLNLQKAQLSHKKLIAEVLLDKNPSIKTVVNKTEALSNVFRTPELEILAGVNNLETEVKEGKCFFKLAYDKVYWNSTLQAERDRMLTFFKENEVILDLFCGVGPLSVRAAKKGCFVIANDLNPYCYKYLKENVDINHVSSKIICANLDARECFYKFVSKEKNEINEKGKYFDHVYMNLPGDAIQFLDVFFGFLKKCDELWLEKKMPLIHVYSFSDGDEVKSRDLLGKRIKCILPNFEYQDMIHFHTIKDVSMNKKMFGITFRLNKDDALGIVANKDKEEKKEEESKGEDVDLKEKIHKKIKLK